VESVPLALFAADRFGLLGFQEMLEQVIAAGGDTDTNASLAGQVAGTAVGFGGLPPRLLQRLPQADLVLSIARGFAERAANRLSAVAEGP
jgi:ADP-ribosylglycohydrolase